MCGIFAIVADKSEDVLRDIIRKSLDAIIHRGPDGFGIYTDRSLGLGHRRLSIIDLSSDGHQPMSAFGEDLVITYNGEIYNYIELRAELINYGYSFQSKTDTEVILAAFHKWGDACVKYFNGMWSFVIYDKRSRSLFASRDRFGVKPFYYHVSADGLIIGSEIRQILPHIKSISANNDNLFDFLLTSVTDNLDTTFFSDIVKLPAGCNLTYKLDDHSARICRYYELKRDFSLSSIRPAEAIDLYAERLLASISLRLRADVPVGTCLSGGLDSSTVASLAAPLYTASSGKQFSAITAVSEQESNNEAAFAQQVVNNSNLEWLQVQPTYNDFVDTLPSVVRTQEEPFGSTSLTMQYFVMKKARESGIPVLLDGQGGDETLLGYPKYYGSYLFGSLRREGVSAFLRAIRSSGQNNAKMSLTNALYFLVGGMVAPARYLVYLSRHRYLNKFPAFPHHLADFSRCSLDEFELQKLEITSTNLPVLLRYEDKNSMAHSIETRLPFLDYRLVETALSLPGDLKIRDGWSKWILRKVMDGKMPDDITWRKNKFGFEAPENLWMTKHAEEMKAVVLRSPLLLEHTKRSALDRGFARLDLRTQWRLYSIALWEKEFGVVA